MNLIEVDRLKKSFVETEGLTIRNLLSRKAKRIVIINGVSFEVKDGELIGIIGRNGAGKSTLLRTIGGVYDYDEGRIITRGSIASIFEMGSFFNAELTGEKYCIDYLRFKGISEKKIKEHLLSIYDFTELGDYFYEPVRTYSSGMQAKLLFGVATSLPAEIILIDEILVVGDEYFQAKAWQRLKAFLDKGAAGIIVSHDWTSLLKLCDRTIILSNKKIEFIGETYRAVQRYINLAQYSCTGELMIKNKDALIASPLYCDNGKEMSVNVEIEVLEGFKEEKFNVSFGIERHIKGIGWTLILQGNSTIDVLGRRNITAKIAIKDLPLSPGEYLLNISLNPEVIPPNKAITKNYDIIHWLNDYAIKLVVNGKNNAKEIIERINHWTQIQ